MSAFLGPIHFWLFHKIELQNELIEEILALKDSQAAEWKEELEEKYGSFPEGNLEENIDSGNIHGWLQQYVSQVEYKLADAVTTLLRKDEGLFEQMKTAFYEKGRELSPSVAQEPASAIYKVIGDSLLDGMPCDHANQLVEEGADTVIWKRNTCVHAAYWEQVGGSVDNYYKLREEFIRGLLSDTGFTYEKPDEVTNVIRRKEIS